VEDGVVFFGGGTEAAKQSRNVSSLMKDISVIRGFISNLNLRIRATIYLSAVVVVLRTRMATKASSVVSPGE